VTKLEPVCLTCYGKGETVTESGPQACPDCFGETDALSPSTKLEWRLREIERIHRHSARETESDILWLAHELRRSREALLRIFARCQDADDADAIARDVKYQANEALGLFVASSLDVAPSASRSADEMGPLSPGAAPAPRGDEPPDGRPRGAIDPSHPARRTRRT
jgi:hypothetical protein